MRIRGKFAGVVLSSVLMVSVPASAQTAIFDVEAISVACKTSADVCLVAVQAAVAALQQAGLSEAQLNTQLGVIAGTAATAAAALPAAEKVAFAKVLLTVADASTNSAQIASLNELAAALQGGASSVDLTAVAQSFSSS